MNKRNNNFQDMKYKKQSQKYNSKKSNQNKKPKLKKINFFVEKYTNEKGVIRFRCINSKKEVLDDCNGFGFKTFESAVKTYKFKNNPLNLREDGSFIKRKKVLNETGKKEVEKLKALGKTKKEIEIIAKQNKWYDYIEVPFKVREETSNNEENLSLTTE